MTKYLTFKVVSSIFCKKEEVMKRKFKKCPCGKNPRDLIITPSVNANWAYVSGSCCDEWGLQFETHFEKFTSDKCREYAEEAWNNAPRE